MDEINKLLLSIKAWPTVDPASTSLAALIPRIQLERGTFREVTEALLEAEIAAQTEQGKEGPDQSNAEEDGDLAAVVPADSEKPMDEKERMEMLARGREEIITEIQ